MGAGRRARARWSRAAASGRAGCARRRRRMPRRGARARRTRALRRQTRCLPAAAAFAASRWSQRPAASRGRAALSARTCRRWRRRRRCRRRRAAHAAPTRARALEKRRERASAGSGTAPAIQTRRDAEFSEKAVQLLELIGSLCSPTRCGSSQSATERTLCTHIHELGQSIVRNSYHGSM
eukprot:4182684-Pleurochrysis_carterae.AAC.3